MAYLKEKLKSASHKERLMYIDAIPCCFK